MLALVLGHLSGAYTYCLAMTVIAVLTEFWWRYALGTKRIGAGELIYAAEDLVRIPVAAALISPFAVFMMAPLTVLALPVALLSAHKLRTGLAATMALGALTGLAVALAGLPFLSHSPDAAAHVAGAAAGSIFAGVIWLLCIRPLRMRDLYGWR
ncbi:MAG: hypothetical protein INR70_35710 [Parafilimonas terrae]|nr:hypothetical protein [Parafilimonas terrae]